jgi:hypothetical protein
MVSKTHNDEAWGRGRPQAFDRETVLREASEMSLPASWPDLHDFDCSSLSRFDPAAQDSVLAIMQTYAIQAFNRAPSIREGLAATSAFSDAAKARATIAERLSKAPLLELCQAPRS